MGNFTFNKLDIEGLYVIEPKVFGDTRGYFMETYEKRDFQQAGINASFVQSNQSKSRKGVLRGLHFQKKHPQGKLVQVVKGEVFDVAVDLRAASPTYGKWHGVRLSEENKKMFYVPEGFAHGYLTLSDEAVFLYQCTDYYYPEDEGGIIWDDSQIGIKWPLEEGISPIISDKDKEHPTLSESKIVFD